ncbi:MAG: hypothetical protein HRT89_23695 [Lentisphaeria bacterium]|nr:hypothetical protein [Lentisphaeria bacterium]NQZ71064.1 hypothetical protein [Lentisphaeria bacterium]
MKNTLTAAFLLILCCSCVQIANRKYAGYDATDFSQRKKITGSLSLDKKAEYFHKRLKKFTVKSLIGRESNSKDVHLEMSCQYLVYLALRYKRLKNKADLAELKACIKSLEGMDKRNGLDGYYPRIVNEKKIYRNETYANAYSQLLWAFIYTKKLIQDKDVHAGIDTQLKRIKAHIIASNYHIKDETGQKLRNSNLKGWSGSRKMDYILFKELFSMDSRQRIPWIHFQWLQFKLPSHSSDWLNMIRLHALCLLSDYYQDNLKKLYRSQKKESNAFFAGLYYSIFPFDEDDFNSAKNMLNSFPLNPDNRQIINSTNPDLKNNLSVTCSKKMHLESISPLPIYQRPGKTYEWKKNPFRLNGNIGSDGKTQYSGMDFLIAYELLKAVARGQ